MNIIKMLLWRHVGFIVVLDLICIGVAGISSSQAVTRCVEESGIGGAECTATYTSIQTAVTAAAAGDTILVGSGTYTEAGAIKSYDMGWKKWGIILAPTGELFWTCLGNYLGPTWGFSLALDRHFSFTLDKI